MTHRSGQLFRTEHLKVTDTNAKILGEVFWNIASHYQLNRIEQAILLGIQDSRGRLNRLEKAGRIPEEYDVFYRVATLMGIHKNLRILFPYNRELVYGWMKTPQPLLNGITPIDFIKAEPVHSFVRLFSVRRLLDQIRVGR